MSLKLVPGTQFFFVILQSVTETCIRMDLIEASKTDLKFEAGSKEVLRRTMGFKRNDDRKKGNSQLLRDLWSMYPITRMKLS